jgi:hypothetical protein
VAAASATDAAAMMRRARTESEIMKSAFQMNVGRKV